MAEYSIGIDLGGTNLRAAAIDRSGKMIGKIAGTTKLSAGREAVVGDMVTAIRSLQLQLGPSGFYYPREGHHHGFPESSGI
jgi:glucokinase